MADRRSKNPLILDPGVLKEGLVCEFQAFDAVAEAGGIAVLPWRHDFLRAEAAGLAPADIDSTDGPTEHDRLVTPTSQKLADAGFSQCAVHLEKSRAGTWWDLAEAWRLLAPGGRLLLQGGNDLGITSAVKRLGEELEQKPLILTNRAHGRIALFLRDGGGGPVRPVATPIHLPQIGGTAHALLTRPGTFSAKQLDPGSGLLLEYLHKQPEPKRVLDLACGAGPLGLMALLQWPKARAVLTDGDHRAMSSAKENAQLLQCEARADVRWLDAGEAVEGGPFDLALLNPPFHAGSGKRVDLEPARKLFGTLEKTLARGGQALVVSNTTLPYERDLREWADVVPIVQARGYKLLSVVKRAKSSSSRRNHSPGSRSGGRS